jgi:hypothetical protein
MATFPRAKTDGVVVSESSDCFVFQNAQGEELARVDKASGLVWRLADGCTSVTDIAEAVRGELGILADSETVWSALDQLADLGLILERITPASNYTSVSRRGALRVASLSAGVATAALVGRQAHAAIGFPSEMSPESELESELLTGGNTGSSGPTTGGPAEQESKEGLAKEGASPKPSTTGPLPSGFPTLTIGSPSSPLQTLQSLLGLKCLITSACVTKAGLADDCHELQALRALRKRHIQFVPGGVEFLREYSEKSPDIVQQIDEAPEAREVWQSLLTDTKHVVNLVDFYRDDEAFEECQRIYGKLRDKYLA